MTKHADGITEKDMDTLSRIVFDDAEIAEPKDRLSAFKALIGWFAIKKKLGSGDEDEEGSGLQEIRDGIAEAGRSKGTRNAKNGTGGSAGHS